MKVLDELSGFSLFLESLPFSFADCLNEALSHSIEYIGVLQIGLDDGGSQSRGHGGDGGFVGDGGAREGRHALEAIQVVPGTGVVFAEIRMDEGVRLGEFEKRRESRIVETLVGGQSQIC